MSTENRVGVLSSFDIAELIDNSKMSALQWRIVFLCMLAAILDGADTFSIGVAAPSIAAKLGMAMKDFGPVFSAALFGAAGGAFAFGPLADRFGRKSMLVVAVLVFAVFTALTAQAGSISQLIGCRFLAGIGLGGATPCFLALAAEFAPARSRASITTLLWAGFPLGGMIGGFLNSYLLAAFDWPMLFYVGGAIPVLVAAAIALNVPEAPSFLLARAGNTAELSRLAGLISANLVGRLNSSTRFILRDTKLDGAPFRHLFTDGRAVLTLLLWVPFFLCFGLLVVVVLWSPALLRLEGMTGPNAALVVAFHGMGGFVGMGLSGKLLERFGALVLIPALLLGALCTLLFGMVGTSVFLAALFDGLIGVFIGIGAAGAIGLAALIYPTLIRSTGIGWAMAFGRIGQVAAPLVAGTMLQSGWQVDKMFLVLAIAPLVAAAVIPILARRMGQRDAAQLQPRTV